MVNMVETVIMVKKLIMVEIEMVIMVKTSIWSGWSSWAP